MRKLRVDCVRLCIYVIMIHTIIIGILRLSVCANYVYNDIIRPFNTIDTISQIPYL